MRKTALITGITGQDGSYMAELLLDKGYNVFGLKRRSSTTTTHRIDHLLDSITFVSGDLTDLSSLISILRDVKPDEVYNLGAQSFVPHSWKAPLTTTSVTGVGVVNVLEAIRLISPKTKFYQASSSEMFGKVVETPQTETTPFYPRSPYGVSKVFGHWATVNYRESYDLFACSGMCFNHESPRRGMEFVTRKVTHEVAKIKLGLSKSLSMGNLDSKRDWGFAGDYVEAMYLMLQNNEPKDYVIATGKTHTVKKLLEVAFGGVGLNYENYVKIDKELYRPAEVDLLVGNATKIEAELGWKPKVSFEELIDMMVHEDIKLLKEG